MRLAVTAATLATLGFGFYWMFGPSATTGQETDGAAGGRDLVFPEPEEGEVARSRESGLPAPTVDDTPEDGVAGASGLESEQQGREAEDRYWLRARFRLLDETLAQEVRDPAWAEQTEDQMRAVAASVGSSSGLDFECRETLCMFLANHENAFQRSEFISDFVHELGPFVDGATVLIGSEDDVVWSKGFVGRRGHPLPLPPGYTDR